MAMLEQTEISERRACLLVEISGTVLHYMPKVRLENEQLQGRMVELASERRRFGYRRIHALLRREGVEANHKRIFRLYQAAGLAVKRRRKRGGAAVEREQLALPGQPNEVWSMDFISDAFQDNMSCVSWSRRHSFVGCPWPFAPIRDRSSPARRWISGLIRMVSSSN